MTTYCKLPEMPSHCHLMGCPEIAAGYFWWAQYSGKHIQVYGACEEHLRSREGVGRFGVVRFDDLDALDMWRRRHIG